MPADQAFAEHLRHAGFLAQTLKAAGGADDQKDIADIAEHPAGPAGIGEKGKALPRPAGDHDADADQKKNERPAGGKDALARRAAAERLAGMSPSDCTISSTSGTITAKSSTIAGQSLCVTVLEPAHRSRLAARGCRRRQSRKDRGEDREQCCERQAQQRDAAPFGAEDGGGRDRHRREYRETVTS